jgi:adenylate cyclase
VVEEPAQRRLATILAADVVGFSRLMEADEAETLSALKTRRKEVLSPLVTRHRGRIFKIAGDSVMVEFGSAVNAVQCAVELQQAMASANVGRPDERHIVLRIGINLGDVLVEGADLYGDGVNIAARLEGIAEPGGIVVSGTAFDHIKSKLKIGFHELGLQQLKNIAEGVRAYRVIETPAIVSLHQSASDKPRVAVLAFVNMSGDQDQEYFSDGITEDIITDLSKASMLSVMARNTTFALKSRAIDLGQLSRQLNVTHVVEGSVRKSGNRVRITAQLIEAKSGNHLWAERYDRDLTDMFALQDEISHAIVAALKVHLAPRERADIGRRTTENVEAYQLYMMARFYSRSGSRQSRRMATDLYRRASELDPNFARAWANLALTHSWAKLLGGSELSLDAIEKLATRALRLDDKLAEAHVAHAEVLRRRGQIAAAELAARRAIELDPTLHMAHFTLGDIFRRSNRWKEAIDAYDTATSLNEDAWWSPAHSSWCYTQIGDMQGARRVGLEAGKRLDRATKFDPEDANAYSMGCFVLGLVGRDQEAVEWANRALELDPGDHLTGYNIACFFLQIGKPDRAFEILERCMPHLGEAQLTWMQNDPDFDRVRNHHRYLALLQREKQRWRNAAGD